MINDYASLSTRAGFNKSLTHFRMVTGIVEQLGKGVNLADIIDDLEKKRGVEKSQITPILNAVVINRMDYSATSFNLFKDSQTFDPIREETAKWNKFDIVVAYHHPQLGISLINPKISDQWESIQEFNREELVVCYLKAKREQDRQLEREALDSLRDLIIGHEVKGTEKFHDAALDAPQAPAAQAPAAPAQPVAPPPPKPPQQAGSIPLVPPPAAPAQPAPPAPPAAAPGAAQSGGPAAAAAPAAAAGGGGKRRVTPKYSVQVTNELFHNGNVEAWKNIVESYKAKHEGLEVHIFHDGQKVNNINALFKWGKVKNGDVILFSVAGEEIKGVAKLQRYLFEGASLRFENYLKKDVNKILNLFG
jgi:hypothetical protein